jgi:2-hydroxymuconate-semialdehyde hydrolase
VAFVDIGEGPPVLLVHGFPTSSYLWRREIWLLAQGMRVIAPDLLGYGESEKSPDANLSEPAQAGYLRELLGQLGVAELAVVGHDVGGAVAQMLALDGGLRIRSLILLDAACFDAWPVEGVRKLQRATPDQETAEYVEEFVARTFHFGVNHEGFVDESSLHAYLEPWVKNPAAFFRAARGIAGRGLAGRDSELAALDIPTFLIWGEDDPFLGSGLADRLQETIDGATLALLPGCSHFVTDDAPTTVGPLIFEFLRTRYLGQSHSHGAPASVFLERPGR